MISSRAQFGVYGAALPLFLVLLLYFALPLLELSWLDKPLTMHLVSSPGGSEFWFLQL